MKPHGRQRWIETTPTTVLPDRVQVERGRHGGTSSSAELPWATRDEDPEAKLAARKGQEHEARYLARVRAEHAGLVEITCGDPAAAERTLAAMTAGAPAIYPRCRRAPERE